jgi:hypothetical protein
MLANEQIYSTHRETVQIPLYPNEVLLRAASIPTPASHDLQAKLIEEERRKLEEKKDKLATEIAARSIPTSDKLAYLLKAEILSLQGVIAQRDGIIESLRREFHTNRQDDIWDFEKADSQMRRRLEEVHERAYNDMLEKMKTNVANVTRMNKTLAEDNQRLRDELESMDRRRATDLELMKAMKQQEVSKRVQAVDDARERTLKSKVKELEAEAEDLTKIKRVLETDLGYKDAMVLELRKRTLPDYISQAEENTLNLMRSQAAKRIAEEERLHEQAMFQLKHEKSLMEEQCQAMLAKYYDEDIIQRQLLDELKYRVADKAKIGWDQIKPRIDSDHSREIEILQDEVGRLINFLKGRKLTESTDPAIRSYERQLLEKIIARHQKDMTTRKLATANSQPKETP